MRRLLLALALLLFVSLPAHAQAPLRILFVGNSLTVAWPAPELDWPGHRGMAASQTDRDYVHRVQLMLAAQTGMIPEIAIVSADVLRAFDGTTITGQHASEFAPHIVIVQMGDNTPATTAYATWLDAYSRVKSWTPDARHIALGLWGRSRDGREETIQQVAAATGMEYIVIRNIHTTATEASHIPTPGVKWHPNDLGMQRIAERVVNVIGTVRVGTIPPEPEPTPAHHWHVWLPGVAGCEHANTCKYVQK